MLKDERELTAAVVGRDEADRPGRAQGRRARTFPFVNFENAGPAARRRLGHRRRQSRSAWAARPRPASSRPTAATSASSLSSTIIQIDAAHQPGQLRRPDLRHLRPGDRREHGDLLALGRLGRHRLRHPGRRGRARHQAADQRRQDRARLSSASRSSTSRPRWPKPRAWARLQRARIVADVTPGGPAAAAGLQAGDVVTARQRRRPCENSTELTRQVGAGPGRRHPAPGRFCATATPRQSNVRSGVRPPEAELSSPTTGQQSGTTETAGRRRRRGRGAACRADERGAASAVRH